MLLSDEFAEFSAELYKLLQKAGEGDPADQVHGLKLVDRCRCGDDFCATIYTQPKPKNGFGFGHRNIPLSPKKGMVILDVVEDRIVCIEVLYRDEMREKLLAILPNKF